MILYGRSVRQIFYLITLNHLKTFIFFRFLHKKAIFFIFSLFICVCMSHRYLLLVSKCLQLKGHTMKYIDTHAHIFFDFCSCIYSYNMYLDGWTKNMAEFISVGQTVIEQKHFIQYNIQEEKQ